MMIKKLTDVPAYQLCCGCGVCTYLYPDEIEMLDAPSFGRRPHFFKKNIGNAQSIEMCPGVALSRSSEMLGRPGLINPLIRDWGPVLKVWEGYASDPEIRFKGSSGGGISAISLYCLEQENMHGVLHVTADKGKPYLNKVVMSRTRDDVLAAAGSRYSPASPC